MRMIVTGGAGFIGSNLVDRLLREGHEVVAVDSLDTFYDPAVKRANLASTMSSPNFRLVESDIRDRPAMLDLFKMFSPEAVIHLAARAGVRPSIEQPALYTEVNVLGTVNLLDAACTLTRKPKFIFASSSSVYGDRPDAPFRETDSVDNPVSPYAATKKATELLAYAYHHLHGLAVTGLRFFTVYGPRNRPDLAIAKFASLIERGEPVPMFGDGSTRRDYTYVDDTVDGIIRAVERCSGYRIYNLGNSSPISLLEMIETIGDALGKSVAIQRLPEQPGDVRQTYADIQRAQDELDYRPATPFRDGIAKFIASRARVGG